jgi:tetratricopeptide (TPR) repeat protein
MTSLSGSIRRIFFAVFILSCIVLVRPDLQALAQETPPYSAEEYNAYTAITAESDSAKKMDLITQFFKTYPKTALKPNIVADFQESLKNLRDAKKWAQVITVGKQFLTFVPDDAYTVAVVAEGYAETKNYQQFVIFGESAFKTNPTGNLAYAMTKAYKEIGNNEKFLEWGAKTVTALPDNYEIMLEMAILYSENQRVPESDKYAKMCLKAMQTAKKPEQMTEKDWTAYSNRAFQASYLIIGSNAWQRQEFAAAIPHLESALKFNARNDMAYYWLGDCYTYTRNTPLALKNYAKASLLGGRAAAPAKQKMENLYKQANRNSLVGIERVTALAKTELGIK